MWMPPWKQPTTYAEARALGERFLENAEEELYWAAGRAADHLGLSLRELSPDQLLEVGAVAAEDKITAGREYLKLVDVAERRGESIPEAKLLSPAGPGGRTLLTYLKF